MMMHCQSSSLFDVAVVGSGPAGAASAMLLARAGLCVLLADRCELPRSKVCGGCLNRATLAALGELNIGHIVDETGSRPYDHMRLVSNQMSAELPLPRGAVIDRAEFDHALVRAAQDAGVQVMSNASVSVAERDADDAHTLRITRASQQAFPVRTRIVIDASGLRSTLFDRDWRSIGPSRIGLGAIVGVREWDGPRPDVGQLLMCAAHAGYIGIAWLDERRLNVAAAIDPKAIKACGSASRAVEMILQQAGIDSNAIDIAWHGSPQMNRIRSRVAGHRWFRVGDATGYVEPFTGEGIAWALAGAMQLVPHVRNAAHTRRPGAAERWTRDVARLRKRQRICRAATWALRHGQVRKSVMRAISAAPVLAEPMTASINRTGVCAHA